MAGDALTGSRRHTTASKRVRVKTRRRRRYDGSENYNANGGRGDWPIWMRCSRLQMDWCRAPRGRVKVSELRVPMDPLNPGQFFACCGLFELMAKAAPEACAHFVADETKPRRAEFVVEGEGLPQLASVLGELREATFELIEEAEESVWPARLSIAGQVFVLDWWLDAFREKPSNLKCRSEERRAGE